MHEDKAEVYVQIVPLLNSDHKRIYQNKNNPVQRIKVSNNTSLLVIASYIHRLAGADASSTTVALYIPYGTESIRLPLSIKTAEFLLMTNQGKEGKVMYSFVTQAPPVPKRPPVPPPKLRKEKPRVPAVAAYPEPIEKKPPAIPLADSPCPLIHSGFSLFSNSFGVFPPTLDSIGFEKSGGATGGTISLRKGLEQILNLQSK